MAMAEEDGLVLALGEGVGEKSANTSPLRFPPTRRPSDDKASPEVTLGAAEETHADCMLVPAVDERPRSCSPSTTYTLPFESEMSDEQLPEPHGKELKDVRSSPEKE